MLASLIHPVDRAAPTRLPCTLFIQLVNVRQCAEQPLEVTVTTSFLCMHAVWLPGALLKHCLSLFDHNHWLDDLVSFLLKSVSTLHPSSHFILLASESIPFIALLLAMPVSSSKFLKLLLLVAHCAKHCQWPDEHSCLVMKPFGL